MDWVRRLVLVELVVVVVVAAVAVEDALQGCNSDRLMAVLVVSVAVEERINGVVVAGLDWDSQQHLDKETSF